ncbi:MAG: DotI/IcmL family type IV secretion protein [Alphaproteobacteria bacterium]|nr:DotI/IcmL family type IV secretion protein [Alphaproteobacteria bacterium]
MKFSWLCLLAAIAIAAPATTVMAQNPGTGQQPLPNPLDPPAPPPSTEAKPDWMGYPKEETGEQGDLSNPHRTPEEIVAWVQSLSTDMLTFTSKAAYDRLTEAGASIAFEEVNTKLFRLKPKFTAKGWAEYAAYAQQSQIIDKVRNHEYSVTTIMNGNAAILDKGPVEGVYRWLVRAPLMITYLLVNEKGEQQAVEDGQFEVTMQLARGPQTGPEDPGLLVEGWNVVAK